MTPILSIVIVDKTENDDVHKALPDIVRALSIQLAGDFQPAWGRPLPALMIGPEPTDGFSCPIRLYADQKQPGILGDHDDIDGNPFGEVFLIDVPSLSVTMSHELLEMILDPSANYWANDGEGKKLYALEACDAVESNEYLIRGIRVSDFVYPAFFDPSAKPGLRKNHVVSYAPPAPLVQCGDGYQIVWDVATNHIGTVGLSKRPASMRKRIRGIMIGEAK